MSSALPVIGSSEAELPAVTCGDLWWLPMAVTGERMSWKESRRRLPFLDLDLYLVHPEPLADATDATDASDASLDVP